MNRSNKASMTSYTDSLLKRKPSAYRRHGLEEINEDIQPIFPPAVASASGISEGAEPREGTADVSRNAGILQDTTESKRDAPWLDFHENNTRNVQATKDMKVAPNYKKKASSADVEVVDNAVRNQRPTLYERKVAAAIETDKKKKVRNARSRGTEDNNDVGSMSLSPPQRSSLSTHQNSAVTLHEFDTRPPPQGGTAGSSTRVGAHAIAGPEAPTDESTLRDDSQDAITINSEQAPQTVVAHAVTNEDMANEIREELRYEIRQEVLDQAVNAEAVNVVVSTGNDGNPSDSDKAAEEGRFWKRKSFIISSIIILIAIVGAVVGAVLGSSGGSGESPSATVSPTFSPAPTSTPAPSQSPATVTVLQTIQGAEEGSRFGGDVAVSRDGGTIAVGANQGNTVTAYRRSDSQWNQIGQVLRGSGGEFGHRVHINSDGTRVAVGARVLGEDKAGQVQAFELKQPEEVEWLPQGGPINGSEPGDEFGWEVAVSDSGGTMAVTARLGDPSGRLDAGYVRVYIWRSNWTQLGQDLEGEIALDSFGRSVALDATGRRVAVGIIHAGGSFGSVQVFDYVGESWIQVGQDINGEEFEAWHGTSVALSKDGSVLAIGAGGSDAAGTNSGMVRVFELSGSRWVQRGSNILGRAPLGKLGGGHLSLSDDGNLVAAGAQNLQKEIGAAYIFRYDDAVSDWVQTAEVTGDKEKDDFGESISLSGDGSVLAVGAPDNGNGYVRVFQVEY